MDAGLHLGAQLEVRWRGETVVSAVVGERRAGEAMTADTLLPWYSCTKVATAVTVAQAWEQRRLDLDAPVADSLPGFGAGGKERVTVRHLLTHTGGFPRSVADAELVRLDWDDAVAAIAAAPLVDGWVPGLDAGYHPVTGFFILGEVVRRADPHGRLFDAIVSEDVFEPLNMSDSWVRLPPERRAGYGARVAPAYDTSVPGEVKPMGGERFGERANPSGSGVGPARDLVRLAEMLLSGGELGGERVLRPETVAAMTSRHREGAPDRTFGHVIDWGLGLMVNSFHYRGRPTSYGYGDHAGRDAFGHGGSQSSLVFADPTVGLSVALICNGRPGEAANHRRTQPVITALYEELGLVPR